MADRLSLALDQGLSLPGDGKIAVLHATPETDLSALPQDRVEIIQPSFADTAALSAQGFECRVAPDGPYDGAIVFVPKAKALARGLIAQAMRLTTGPVIVDGAKTAGIDSLWKAARGRYDVQGPISKAHGKLFWMHGAADGFSDWMPEAQKVGDFVTAPGVFSADGVDPASQLLADALPRKLGAHVVDLGAGWGFLAAQVLTRPQVEILDLVEDDHIALDCARQNLSDPRARFHWNDATQWVAQGRVDCVVMNPPFHKGRSADPDIGRAFIKSASRLLAPSGHLWMVANRHLPYEAALSDHFGRVEEPQGDRRFKILHATRPTRLRR